MSERLCLCSRCDQILSLMFSLSNIVAEHFGLWESPVCGKKHTANPRYGHHTPKWYLFVVAVAGIVLRFARAHPIVSVTQASTGAVLGLLRADQGLLDDNASRSSRRGVSQLCDAGDEQRQVTKVLEELDRPPVPSGIAGLLATRSRVFQRT